MSDNTAAATAPATAARIPASTWDRSAKATWDVHYDGKYFVGSKVGGAWRLFGPAESIEAAHEMDNIVILDGGKSLRGFWKLASAWFAAGMPVEINTGSTEPAAEPVITEPAAPAEPAPVTAPVINPAPAAERYVVQRAGKGYAVIDTAEGDKIVFRNPNAKAANNRAEKLNG